ncbi:D-isomer specific 2-hydroxyacid dehydrogenase [Colletotrichum graminicola]|uniref:D-isomer specific 2-hydroxyacid dehydrogenase n=1 Tax=Colletotrichum graminicola (strain M1.001 / M2 / FGSC 10212) TaxID=645133 RepID=E3QRU1_COLGM|nr:D-isomer specific 2-hydroxyacid dehydrogenase [Colletotrichum graminicola M1.001]EFQ33579.1 D-isomer specific 2-hydroxyacid dehydrogenase [Colletotrichum graminicola M1.001]WDK10869.1 D-isomer specific 2-hydroxyacid dehydrogenase [Colletotrichum graminicola]
MGDLLDRPSPLAQDVLLLVLAAPENTAWKRRVLERFPGLEIRWVNSSKPGGGYIVPDEVPDEIWDGVTIFFSYIPASAQRMSKVRFVQASSAGVDLWVGHELYKNPNVSFCTTNGCQSPQIAEWVIGTWLSSQHHFQRYADNMKEGFWEGAEAVDIEDSVGLRMGILGYGAIGRQCGKIAQAIGMEVYAYTRSDRSTPESRRDDSYCIPGTGDPEGLIPAKWFHGSSKESLNNFLSQGFDILVLCLPLTRETKGFFGKEQFDILSKRKTFVSNIARGGLVQNDAFVEALETGKIRAAAVDVTDPEPLPKDHPLWKAPNVFITPHVSWRTKGHFERVLGLLEANLERLHSGKPLINVVNRDLHY